MFMLTCLCADVVHVCAHAYGGWRKSQLSFSGTSSIFFETNTLIGLELTSEFRLATSKPSESSCFHPPVLGLQDCDIRLSIITCIVGDQTQVLVLTWQVFYWLSCHSCFLILIFNPKIARLGSHPVNVRLLSIPLPL